MRYPTPEYIQELNEKLKTQGDTTEQEADTVRSLFSQNCAKTKLNPNSAKFDFALFDSLTKFIKTAVNIVKQGKLGAFISSFPVCPPPFMVSSLKNLLREIIENLPPKDRAAIFNVSFYPLKDGEDIVNGVNVFENTQIDNWVIIDYVVHHLPFCGFCPDCLGAFRRGNLKKAFENYTDVSVVSDPFHYFVAEFYFDYSGCNIIHSKDILSDALVYFIVNKNIPFLVYGDADPTWRGYWNEHVAVESGLARKITEAVKKNEKDIIAEMEGKGLIYHSKRDADTYSKYLELIEGDMSWESKKNGIVRLITKDFNAEEWYRFDDYHRMINFACNLLNEILRYGRTIDSAREKDAEEDVWVLR